MNILPKNIYPTSVPHQTSSNLLPTAVRAPILHLLADHFLVMLKVGKSDQSTTIRALYAFVLAAALRMPSGRPSLHHLLAALIGTSDTDVRAGGFMRLGGVAFMTNDKRKTFVLTKGRKEKMENISF